MAFWWVSQNQTWRQEREGGYLWAPNANAQGQVFHHWSSMEWVRPGDIIFSYAKQAIGAVAVASSSEYFATRPESFGEGWDESGRKIDVVYRPVEPELKLAVFVDELAPLLPNHRSPITRNKTGVQGYLFSIPPKAAELICLKLEPFVEIDRLVGDALEQTVPDKTEREALIKARVGQGRWRQMLLSQWSGGCAITGLGVEKLLRASHIKPWRASDNKERLDPMNGFLLAPVYDAAFDAGLITFSDAGKIVISPRLNSEQAARAGISDDAAIMSIKSGHLPYLAYHRSEIFLSE